MTVEDLIAILGAYNPKDEVFYTKGDVDEPVEVVFANGNGITVLS